MSKSNGSNETSFDNRSYMTNTPKLIAAAPERRDTLVPQQEQRLYSLAAVCALSQGNDFLIYHPQSESPFGQPDHSRLTPNCLCSQRALYILRGLEDPYKVTSYNITLSANRQIVCSLLEIISCSHTDDTSFNNLLFTIGVRLIDSYQFVSSQTTPSSATTTIISSRLPTLSVASTTLEVGKLNDMHTQSERSRMRVVLDELQATERLIEEFQAWFCTGPVNHKTNGRCELITSWRTALRYMLDSCRALLDSPASSLDPAF